VTGTLESQPTHISEISGTIRNEETLGGIEISTIARKGYYSFS